MREGEREKAREGDDGRKRGAGETPRMIERIGRRGHAVPYQNEVGMKVELERQLSYFRKITRQMCSVTDPFPLPVRDLDTGAKTVLQ